MTSSLDSIFHSLWNFRDLSRTRSDVEDLLFAVPTLMLSIIQSPAADGPSLRLLGTVPISYQGSNYDIPVELLIKPNYPRDRPLFFVRPTPDMMITPSHPCVDSSNGAVVHPYLTRWLPSDSTLAGLVTVASEAFSSSPPVYARGNSTTPTTNNNNNNSNNTNSNGSNNPPPPPIRYHNSSYSATIHRTNTSTNNNNNNNYNSSPTDRPPPSYASAAPPPAYHPPAVDSKTEEEKKKQRLVAIITARLKKSIKEEFHPSIKREFKEEMELQSKLEQGKQEVDKCITRLREYGRELDSQREELEFRYSTLASWVEMNNRNAQQQQQQRALNVDELVQPVDVQTGQLFDNVAETNAIEDCLFHLDRALHRGRIDLKTFLKHVRALSRMQFLSTALSLKILEIRDATRGSMDGGNLPRYPAIG
jgi:ESCRT-I complex subunit TSG101